jgi:hypothetical protein
MFMMDAGARSKVWTGFDPETSPEKARKFIGTDQAWIGSDLGSDEATWPMGRGIYNFRRHFVSGRLIRREVRRGKFQTPPVGAQIVFFTGLVDPSLKEIQELHPWIKQHWKV